MTYRSADLTAELHDLVDTAPPPSMFDLDAARARGAVVRRRRRAARAGSGLVAAGLATVLAVSLVPHSAPSVAPTDGGGRPKTDPLTSTVAFGWLPGGVRMSGGGVDAIVASDGTSQFDLTALAPGAGPTCQPSRCTAKAPDVNGHAAYWIIAPGSARSRTAGFVELEWEYAPGTWADLDAKIGDDASGTVTGVAHKVAENARFGAAEPMPLPFRLPAIPADMKFSGVRWRAQPEAAPDPQLPGNAVAADLGFGILDRSTNTVSSMDYLIQQSGPEFPTSEELTLNGVQAAAVSVQPVTVEGHQAVVINATAGTAPVQELIVHDVGGVDFTLTAVNPLAIAFVHKAGGIIEYYKSIDVLGADRNDWTTDVLG